MELFIVIVGALGAWLLVAGPAFQAALELREQEIDREGIQTVMESIAPVPRISPWWWLLPPVAYLKHRTAGNVQRDAIMDGMTVEQRTQMVNFTNKAHGWFIVAFGAFLIALKETWDICKLTHIPIGGWIGICLVAAILCVGSVVYQLRRADRTLKRDEDKAEDRRLVRNPKRGLPDS